MVGIVGYGGYVPRLRLQRKAVVQANSWFNPGLKAYAKGERAMCNWDEDSLTMAVEAARDCLGACQANDLRAVYFASTSMPFADRQNAGILSTALALGENLSTLDITSSQRAGTSGLITALNAQTGIGGQLLYATADKRRTKAASQQELLFGDGAAAFLLGASGTVADLLGWHQVAIDFVDHYRGENEEFDYTWEERWIRDEGYLKIVPRALKGLFDKTGLKGEQVDRFIMPCVLRGVPEGIAKRAGIGEAAVANQLQEVMGESGAAHALVMLSDALQAARPGETIVLIGWGQGCDVLAFRTTPAIAGASKPRGIKGYLARRKEETNYSKFLAFNDLVTREKGLRSEVDKQTPLTTLYRKKDMLLAMMGGKCRVCGTVQFPKANVCVNPNCGAFHSQDDHPFADTPAKIQSWTADQLTYSPDPPAYCGMVVFDEGGRFMSDFTDMDADKANTGQKMRMVFRIKEHDDARGFTKYFWKATPAY
ncbi:MAG: 3-hydroxy-3-methylglutaryl CoA synthase [Alphaproteobacteria bacterium]|nr:3-hydroxy-3-methylglutaryl CoA synthase [Alphaproteobacteria bacterium]